MDPITTIVTVLSLGAAAGLQDTAAQVIKDGYRSLKNLIQRKYTRVNLELLEVEPASKARQAVVAEDLRKTTAVEDVELLQQVQKLLETIQTQGVETAKVVGVSLADIKAASLDLSAIVAQGTAYVTGVEMKGADIAGDIKISHVKAGNVTMPAPVAQQSPTKPAQKNTILFLAANPLDTARLRLDEEIRAIDQTLQATAGRNQLEIQQHWAIHVADLQGALMRHRPAIVHFSGHGSTTGDLVLQDDAGITKPVSAKALGQLFSLLKNEVRCVVLNACYSEPQAQAIAEHVACVVGMSKTIGDKAAITFATAFYQALGYGEDVKTAFELGRTLMEMEAPGEQNTPQLLALNCDPAQLSFVKHGDKHPKVQRQELHPI